MKENLSEASVEPLLDYFTRLIPLNKEEKELVICVLTGSCLENPSISNMIVADPVIRNKINLPYAGVSQAIFLFIEISSCEDTSGHKRLRINPI